jgi:hypothetical protein
MRSATLAFVSGHGFSRAARCPKMSWALAPVKHEDDSCPTLVALRATGWDQMRGQPFRVLRKRGERGLFLFVFFFASASSYRFTSFQECLSIFIKAIEMGGKRPTELSTIFDCQNVIDKSPNVFDLPWQAKCRIFSYPNFLIGHNLYDLGRFGELRQQSLS